MASGANNTFRQVGIATGIAALGTVFDSQMKSKVTGALITTPAGRAVARDHGAALATALASGQIRTAVTKWTDAQKHAVLNAFHGAFASSFDHLAVIAAVVAFVGSIAGFALVRQKDFVVMSHGGGGAPGGGGPGGAAAPAGESVDGARTPSDAAPPADDVPAPAVA
jgi:hypothetical protein